MSHPLKPLRSTDNLSGSETRANQLFQAGQGIEPLSELDLARIRQRLLVRPLTAHRPAWALLAAAGVFCVSAASAGYYLLARPAPAPNPMGIAGPTQTTEVRTLSSRKAPGASASSGQLLPLPARLSLPESTPAQAAPTTATSEATSPTISSSLERESAMVAEALSALRRQKDPERALALLDTHARQFPRGALRSEALVARAEALDRLGKSTQALALLDGAELASPHLLVLRGNLRAKLNRCESAVQDYDRALRTTNAEALIGRADCHVRLGQREAATRDYQIYLREFPDGRHALRAREALGLAPR